ncbi:MAG: right-handed parallel beta-helix repeat-containing protein [Planctomycetota bacterium]|jgi:parallel beta-helix repeat protein
MWKLAFVFVCLLLAIPCNAEIIIVDPNGSGDFVTVQAAINAANEGDEVVLAISTYTGAGNKDLNFGGKAITIRSNDPNDPNVVAATVIDCQGSYYNRHGGFVFQSGEDANSILAGLTICNGFMENGGGISCLSASPTIINCTISGNTAVIGSGMYNDNSNPKLSNCTFIGNSASSGGGMYSYNDSSPTLSNCTFSNNSATSGGGGMYSYDSSPTLTNCTFSGNSANSGGGIFCRMSNIKIANSVLWHDTPQEIFLWSPNNNLDITYSNIQGHWPGYGNISRPPFFVDPNNNDYHLKSQAGRYDPVNKLWVNDAITSSSIDAGNPATSLDSEPNDVNNTRINMGAYGGTCEASKTPPYWTLLADLSNDGLVNFLDFTVQASDWKKTDVEQPGDLTRDGTVDTRDLNVVAKEWLQDSQQLQDHYSVYSDYFASNPTVAKASINNFDEETLRYFWQYIEQLENDGFIQIDEPVELQACEAPEECRRIYLTDAEIKRILAAKTAHSMWLDKNDMLPWRLRNYTQDKLNGLFSKDVVIDLGYSFLSVVDYSPSDVYAYIQDKQLVKNDILNTVYVVLDDLRADFLHGSGDYGDPMLTAYSLYDALTNYSVRPIGPIRVARNGCYSMSRITLGVLRSVNIPGEEVHSGEWYDGGHSSAKWTAIEGVMPHGDDIYIGSLTEVPSDEFLVPFTFYDVNVEPCGDNKPCISHRHRSLKAVAYPSYSTLVRCCDPNSYGYESCKDYLVDQHGAYLTQEEIDAAVVALEALCE